MTESFMSAMKYPLTARAGFAERSFSPMGARS